MAGRFSLEAIFKGVDRLSRPIARMQSRFDRMTRGMASGLRTTNRIAERTASVLGKMGLAAGAVGAAGVAGVVKITQAANEVEDALAMASSVVTPFAGTVEDASKRMKVAALDWSKAHHDTAADFLKTTYQMISAGLDEKAALAATRTAMMVATATMGEGAEAAGLIATVFNNMGNKTADVGKEMTRLGDIITRTQQTFQFENLNQLNEGLKYGIPSALQFGMSIEQLSTTIGQLNNAGLQGSMAGTAFAAAMRNMTKAGKDLRFTIAKTAEGGVDLGGTLANMEKKFGSLSKMSDDTKAKLAKAFGEEGWRAISLMIGKSDEFSSNLEKVTKSAGAAADATAQIESKGSKPWEIMNNKITAAQISLKDALQPALDKVADGITKATDGMTKWIDKNKEWIAQGISEKMDTLSKSASAFGEGFGSGFGDSLKVLGEAFSKITGNGGDAVGVAREFGNVLGTIANVVIGVAAGMLTFVSGMVDTATQIVGSIIEPFATAWANISAIFDAEGMSLTDKMLGIGKQVILGLVRGMAAVAMAPVEAVQGWAVSWIDAAKTALGIHSPSAEFAKLGEMTGLGFQAGLAKHLGAMELRTANDGGADGEPRSGSRDNAPQVTSMNRYDRIERVERVVLEIPEGAKVREAPKKGGTGLKLASSGEF